jgi:transcription antitermination factor NusG
MAAHTYWTVLETKSASSAEAIRHVSQQSFTYYHPKFREPARSRDGLGVRRVRSLFPNYLFVQIDPRGGEWRRLCSTRGVARVFLNGSEPARVADDAIVYLQDREDDLGYVVPDRVVCCAVTPVFEIGDTVVARSTSTRAIYAGLGSKKNTRRIVYALFGRELILEASVYDLAAA